MSSHCLFCFFGGFRSQNQQKPRDDKSIIPSPNVCVWGGKESLHVRVPAQQERECAGYLCIRVFSFLRSAVLRNRSSSIPSSLFLFLKFDWPFVGITVPARTHVHTASSPQNGVATLNVDNPNGKSSISLLDSRTRRRHEKDAG